MAVPWKDMLIGSGLFFYVGQAAAGVPARRLRTDLQQQARFFCAPQQDMRALWQAGIYDTLLSLRTSPRAGPGKQLARTQAQREGGAGYAYGNCEDGRSWRLSVSAPYAAVRAGNKVKLAAGLQHYCRVVRARYAPSGLQRTRVVTIAQHELLLPTSGSGLVAVNCLSRHPDKTGPRLLYIFPVGKPAKRAPLLPQQVPRSREPQAVQAWVAALRAKLGLAALPLQKMPPTATRLSVIHDRTELYAVKQALHQRRLRLLGENRARGRTLTEALTLLWVSPFHRDLLLHDAATYLMVDIVRQDNQVLVTMLVNGELPRHQR